MPRHRRNAYGPQDLQRMRQPLFEEEPWLEEQDVYDGDWTEPPLFDEMPFLPEEEPVREIFGGRRDIVPSRPRRGQPYADDQGYDRETVENVRRGAGTMRDVILADRTERGLRDPVSGRRWMRRMRGDPNDPNYFMNPYNRETLQLTDNNWLQDLTRNHLGMTGDVYLEHEPLTIRDEVRGPTLPFPPLSPPPSPLSPPVFNDNDFRGNGSDGFPGIHTTSISRPDSKNLLHTRPGGKGCCQFSNSEYIQDITSLNNSFNLTTVVANPGLYTTFPVLAQVAQGFIFYKFTKLVFRFVSTCNDTVLSGGTGTSMGAVCLVVNQNVSQQSPVNFQQLANWPGAKVFKPSLSVKYDIDCTTAITGNYFMVRTNPTFQTTVQPLSTIQLTWGQNQSSQPTYPGAAQLTDFVNFYIGTTGVPASFVVGELFVDYTVELCAPYLYGTLNGAQNLYYRAQIGVKAGSTNGIVSPLVTGYGNLQMQVVSSGGNALTITFPPSINTGCYCIQLYLPQPYSGQGWSTSTNSGSLQLPSLKLPTVSTAWQMIYPQNWQTSGGTSTDIGYEYSVAAIQYVNQYSGVTVYDNNVYCANGSWLATMCFTLYIQILKSNCVIVWPGVTGDWPVTTYAGSLSVSQLHPNFQYSWSSGLGVQNP